jgi:hypothetical protein
MDSSTFEQANAGIQYQYVAENGFRPNVYVYPHAPAQGLCLGDCRTAMARREVESFKELTSAMIQRGYYDSMTVVRDESFPAPAGSWLGEGRHVTLRVVQRGEVGESHFLVWAGQETLVKIRATYPVGQFPTTQLKTFANELVAEFPPRYSCPLAPSRSNSITASVVLPKLDQALADRIDGAFADLPAGLSYRAPAQGQWRSEPTFVIPRGVPPTIASPERNPGYILSVTFEPRGDSVSMAVTTAPLCEVPATGEPNRSEPGMVYATMISVLTSAKINGKR